MAAVSAYMNGPQRFFLLPPKHQRDQSQLEEALLELEYFFDHYGETEGRAVRRGAARRDQAAALLEHELYVAEYYLDPRQARGGRSAGSSRRTPSTPGIGLDAEVLFLLGVTYLRLDEVELARSTFSELQSQHPDHHRGKQARTFYLPYIHETYGPARPPAGTSRSQPAGAQVAAAPEEQRAAGKSRRPPPWSQARSEAWTRRSRTSWRRDARPTRPGSTSAPGRISRACSRSTTTTPTCTT